MALSMSGIGSWITFRLVALYPYVEGLHFFCAVAFSFGIGAIHYTYIVAGVTFVHVPGKLFIISYPLFISLSQNEVFIGVVVASLIYSSSVLLVALIDLRLWFYRLSRSSRLIDEMIVNLDTRINVAKIRGSTDLVAGEYENFMIDKPDR
jgi:hypothetical protein